MNVLERLKYIAKISAQPNHWTVLYVGGLVEEALPQAEADAQALADLRALDDWARKHDQCWRLDHSLDEPGEECSVALGWDEDQYFDGATPDEARAKAAAWVREQARKAGA